MQGRETGPFGSSRLWAYRCTVQIAVVSTSNRRSSRPRREDEIVGCGREPCQPDAQEGPGPAVVPGRGPGVAGVTARGFGLGLDRLGRLDDLEHGLPRERGLRVVAGEHPQPEHVRQAARLVIFYLVGDGHSSHFTRAMAGQPGTKVLGSRDRTAARDEISVICDGSSPPAAC